VKLLLNTESLRPPLTGIGNYTLNLLLELEQLQQLERIDCLNGPNFSSPQERLEQYRLAAAADSSPATHGGAMAARSSLRKLLRGLPLAYRAREAVRNLRLRQTRQKYRDFVYHEPNFILKEHAGPSVATIHDLSFIHYPQFHPSERVAWMTRELPKTLQKADLLITDSEIIRRELLDGFGVDENKVKTIYLGAAECYRPQDQTATQAVLARHGLRHGAYCLFVGTLEPRKGLDTLLDAWMQLPQPLRREYPLVLAGAPGWHNQELLQRIGELAAKGELHSLQFVPAEELPVLYAGAAAFVYPSLYEGFGLPVLEAMSCGIPVVCTADTSMAEFSAGTCLLFERGNSEALAAQLRRLLEASELRQTLAQATLKRAAEFSWRRCAEETLEAYRRAAG
jgi:alpha-1,3-rhamnosyl/mannosyltransferase